VNQLSDGTASRRFPFVTFATNQPVGGHRVHDELRDDADVRGGVLQALTLDAAVPPSIDGTVTLSGHVDSWVEHDAAVNAAWAAPGVRTVDDAIVVDY
jgi:osmotically-inducible protein OsmY